MRIVSYLMGFSNDARPIVFLLYFLAIRWLEYEYDITPRYFDGC